MIQTHGWSARRFAIDGESAAGYAAQALAGQGVMVAQLGTAEEITTIHEGERNLAQFEAVIDELDRRGWIDRARVGVQGWSRTVFHVRYALSFSKYPIAAALAVDGIDAGYVEYVLLTTSDLHSGNVTSEQINGALPYGAGLKTWMERSPDFNLDRVHTPLLQFMFDTASFVTMWESYAGLKRLHKPVDMIVMPDAAHNPVRPAERHAVQQRTVDWFRYWLQDYEDTAPEKRADYLRWHTLRAEHAADLKQR